jgi:hypothetical protein
MTLHNPILVQAGKLAFEEFIEIRSSKHKNPHACFVLICLFNQYITAV